MTKYQGRRVPEAKAAVSESIRTDKQSQTIKESGRIDHVWRFATDPHAVSEQLSTAPAAKPRRTLSHVTEQHPRAMAATRLPAAARDFSAPVPVPRGRDESTCVGLRLYPQQLTVSCEECQSVAREEMIESNSPL